MSLSYTNNDHPSIISDPRFRAGRNLIQSGKLEEATAMFGNLLEIAIQKYGDADIETSCVYYEYGNALFRAANEHNNKVNDDSTENDTKANYSSDIKKSSSEGAKDSDEYDTDDFQLALEQMENAFAIIDEYISSGTKESCAKADSNNPNDKLPNIFLDWAQDQIPRILTGIGDLFVSTKRYPEGIDAYTRAIPYRETRLNISKNNCNERTESLLEHLRQSRLLCESNILVSETLLQCPADKDIIIEDESGNTKVLVSSSERVDFARGYYDKARDELQNSVFLMGKIASTSLNGIASLGEEKENICYLATMLMGVGTTLTDLDAEQEEKIFPHDAKKARKP